jgi:hypothetical protein
MKINILIQVPKIVVYVYSFVCFVCLFCLFVFCFVCFYLFGCVSVLVPCAGGGKAQVLVLNVGQNIGWQKCERDGPTAIGGAVLAG